MYLGIESILFNGSLQLENFIVITFRCLEFLLLISSINEIFSLPPQKKKESIFFMEKKSHLFIIIFFVFCFFFLFFTNRSDEISFIDIHENAMPGQLHISFLFMDLLYFSSCSPGSNYSRNSPNILVYNNIKQKRLTVLDFIL